MGESGGTPRSQGKSSSSLEHALKVAKVAVDKRAAAAAEAERKVGLLCCAVVGISEVGGVALPAA